MSKSERLEEQRKALPTYEYRQELIDAIREYNILVVIGETGSGKTTQIPQYILEGLPDVKKIGVTQPRRIAAITVAKRVSEEQNCRLGTTVGYSIRFDDKTGPDTRLKYMTDGVLLREATQDPYLNQYSVIIIDEAHERTLETDVLFGLLKKTHRLRPELKILIMSATLDVEKFSDFFEECPIFEIPGRNFPVEIIYNDDALRLSSLKPTFVERAVDTAWQIHTTHAPGDILVFLTGQHDIERACRSFEERAKSVDYRKSVRYFNDGEGVRDVAVYPLYASLETYEQKAVFELPRTGVRKVVFATNVAQTSVTIPGIRYVVDSGFVKEKSYDPNTGMDALLVTEISQAAAIQRAGRAGRTAPGKAYRLYTEESFHRMLPNTVPEIQRSSLLSTVLALKKMNIVDVIHFEFIDPPDETLVKNALKQLYLLGAIDEVGQLTPLGDKMSYFPLSPSLARVLISAAEEHGCAYEVLTIASILAGENDLFRAPSVRSKGGEQAVIRAEECKLRFAHHTGDHMTYLNVWREWKRHDKDRAWCREHWVNSKILETAASVRSQLQDVMDKLQLPIKKAPRLARRSSKSDTIDPVPILKSFLTGYFTNIANKGANRSVFSHYSPDEHLIEGISADTLKSGALVALHLHPLCAFSDMLDRNKIRYAELDWVLYTHVTYTNKAVMKGVSKILWDWVKSGQGQERIHKLPNTRLNGEDAPNVKEMEHKKGDKDAASLANESRESIAETKQESASDKIKRRAEQIEEIRQRALSRRKLHS
ncbi:P-loop containing nucleoside triphosphate hydrolase protein [Radiomyces spectabilis]|uniref:P-loop containing nucleoside triphosphate hydrolase protein n=1 Tax=Radiomyces spectabilis TaxID=64574 RepID=UPI002220C77C|nr:P-loop containing nucleoside triphosphate hydrolase protein [Radiomyces spectabilis]KAI8377905.1 P-loop containing nucleoside triphosphate hydrolase protein [Radiomyces spectabilis]